MGIQKEVVFTEVSDAVNFAGSLLLGTNLFQEFPLLFDFKNGNVLMTEKEEDIYDHTVMPLEILKGDSNGLISKKSSGNKGPKEEIVMSEDDELPTDVSGIENKVIEKEEFFPTFTNLEKELSLKRFESGNDTDTKDDSNRIHSITLGSIDRKFEREIKKENLIESEKSKYLLKVPENAKLEPNTKRFLEVNIESEAGTKPPELLNVLVHKTSEFLDTGELLIANSISTVRDGKVLI